jgi:hypothetical protein
VPYCTTKLKKNIPRIILAGFQGAESLVLGYFLGQVPRGGAYTDRLDPGSAPRRFAQAGYPPCAHNRSLRSPGRLARGGEGRAPSADCGPWTTGITVNHSMASGKMNNCRTLAAVTGTRRGWFCHPFQSLEHLAGTTPMQPHAALGAPSP